MRNEIEAAKQHRLEKAEETRTSNEQQRNKKLIVGGYMLYWFDDYNWCVEPFKNGENSRKYYPGFVQGCHALLNVVIDKAAKSTSDINRLCRLIEDAKVSIEKEVRLWG